MASLHKYVCWWEAPELRRANTIFLVKLLQPVRWQPDPRGVARGVAPAPVRVRVCDHEANKGHPSIGQEFLARPQALVPVQYGMHNV